MPFKKEKETRKKEHFSTIPFTSVHIRKCLLELHAAPESQNHLQENRSWKAGTKPKGNPDLLLFGGGVRSGKRDFPDMT